ncbi:MAG TPA: YSC84-related protein, partial [Hyphomicrobiaceae bacterium]|nr:YSC84-related protein [Hyphomicrobiaceae bacterium]
MTIMYRICRNLALALVVLTAIATAPRGEAATAAELDASVRNTLEDFFTRVHGSRELVSKAAAVLVFPTVVKAGFGIGGEYGEGSLLTRERTVDYYNLVSASIGFQLGAQTRSVIIVFMTPEALHHFRRTQGWKVGVDASVAVVTVGTGGSIDTSRINHPIVGFIFDNK